MYTNLIKERLAFMKNTTAFSSTLTAKNIEKMLNRMHNEASGIDFEKKFINSVRKGVKHAIMTLETTDLEVMKFGNYNWRLVPALHHTKVMLEDAFNIKIKFAVDYMKRPVSVKVIFPQHVSIDERIDTYNTAEKTLNDYLDTLKEGYDVVENDVTEE